MNDAPAPACCICYRGLLDDEMTQRTCRICARRIDETLLAFTGPSGLYARVNQAIMPGSGSAGPAVSGTKTPGIPPKLEALSLASRGGLVTLLQTWVEDWASYGHATLDTRGALQRQVDEAVRTLRFNLDWAIRSHGAIDDFAHEVWKAERACRVQASEEPPPRDLKAPCPCGNTIRYTLDTEHRRCRTCHTEYGRAELIDLTRGHRSMAA
ncbi:hypothetical protein ACFWDI_28200 [Streptomyces sp. NPDC060064]|uniref:hypothetical protein n=1 Tax=Streptomyces sp. NPDC060064 TaxID=3347049 RepID=UPI00367E5A95